MIRVKLRLRNCFNKKNKFINRNLKLTVRLISRKMILENFAMDARTEIPN